MRNHIEGKFGQGKNGYNLNKVRARAARTSESWIAAIFFVLNLVKFSKEFLFSFLKEAYGSLILVLNIFILTTKKILSIMLITFSPNSNYSYGFRPGRNAHQAIEQAEQYINEGYNVVVDLDLEKFFDRVNLDKLMYLLAKRISDKRVLKLIRAYLESGVMLGGLASPTREGTLQGGPLSPLLSNVMLHELDKELERRGHRFCRYADDCNIYVKSKKSGNRGWTA